MALIKRKKKGQDLGPDAVLFSSEVLGEEEMPSDHAIREYSHLLSAKRWMKWVLVTMLAMVPLLLGMSIFQAIAINDQQALLEERSTVETIDSPNKALAQEEVIDWLGGDPSPMPGARLLSWDRAAVTTEPSSMVDAAGGERRTPGVERHELSVLSDTGARYTAVVQISFDEALGAAVMGAPTLIPVLPGDEQQLASSPLWPGLESAPQSPSMDSAVKAWAEALFSGDPEALKLAVSDPDPARGYLPMPSGSVVGTRVESVVAAPDAETRESDSDPATSVVARVSVLVDYVSTTEQDRQSSQGATYTYDVLLREANTASPHVSAWGGPGTGHELTDFANGIQGRLFTSNDAAEAAPSADPSASAASASASASTPAPTTAPASASEPSAAASSAAKPTPAPSRED